MKKFFIMFVISLFLFTGCSNGKLTTYTEISYDDYVNMMDNGESFPLVIGSSTCSACSMFKGTMESFIPKYQVNVRYLDISKLSDEQFNLLKSEINFSSTPTTIFVENGKHTSVYYRIVGSENLSNVVKAYTKMGYLKEA